MPFPTVHKPLHEVGKNELFASEQRVYVKLYEDDAYPGMTKCKDFNTDVVFWIESSRDVSAKFFPQVQE